MTARICRVTYFHVEVEDKPGETYWTLSYLAGSDVNLLAFSAIPTGPTHTHLVLFPENVESLARAAEKTGLVLSDPQHAFLIQGDDKVGALIGIHEKLFNAHINVYASSGVSDGKGGYGYIVYVKAQDFEDAAQALGV